MWTLTSGCLLLVDAASCPAGAMVGSVTTQISTIHLTRQGGPPSTAFPSSPSQTVVSSQECVMQVDGAEEELPDELENACSDDSKMLRDTPTEWNRG